MRLHFKRFRLLFGDDADSIRRKDTRMSDPAGTLELVEQRIGVLTQNQRSVVLAAIAENAAGVLALAEQIGFSTSVDNPPAVFMSAVNRGDHTRPSHRGVSMRVTPEEAFAELYRGKTDELGDTSNWSDARIREEALDYAVSYVDRCKISAYPAGASPITLEDDLRRATGHPRPATRNPEARARMLAEWRLIKGCLHDRRIAGMHHALMDGFGTPREPTHAEAVDARSALVAEISALGVKPRLMEGPPVVEGWSSIGTAAEAELDKQR